MVSSQPVSEFVFHPAHNHWHITGVALFEVRLAPDNGKGGRFGAVYANQSIKTTFCLIDWIKLEGNSPTGGPHTTSTAVGTSLQGISAGWGDQYHHALDGPGARDHGREPPGIYYLVSTANAERELHRDRHGEQHGVDELPAHPRQPGQREGGRGLAQPVQRLAVRRGDLQNR